MKQIKTLLLASCTALALLSCTHEESIESVIERGLQVATEQALLMAEALENQEGRLPKTIDNGQLETSDCYWWCSGFFPGELWYLYENSRSPKLLEYAKLYTERVREVQYITNNHDVGFMINCSFGNAYRITGDQDYKNVILTGAESLCTRYNPVTRAIRSWDDTRDGRWQYAVIIDNMMNLEILTNASRLCGDKRFSDIANIHAHTTIDNHFRDDFSTYHLVSLDTLSGIPHIKQTVQGYADDSAWSRGQAWGLYGFTMMARETGKREYLHQAKAIAAFLMKHPRMPKDKIPYWDFDAPNIPNEPRDASAAAIMASALVELSQIDNSSEASSYLEYAEDQIRTLSSPQYLAQIGDNSNFLLMHSTGNFPGDSEVDVPLSYADYYYVEALMRLKKLAAK